jgi:hypothetical protein
MDEIFDRIKQTKIKRKYLVSALVFTEILGIITLIWYLRSPLYDKYLVSSPKAYSIQAFSSEKTYLLNQGDFLRGQTSPNNQLVIILRQGKKQIDTLKPALTKDGNWTYQIPESVQPGRYTFTLGYETPDNKISSQNYRIRIKSKLIDLPLIGNLLTATQKFKIEDITLKSPSEDNQGTKNNYFKLLINKKDRAVKQLEQGITYSHSSPQNLLDKKPISSTNSAIFFVQMSGENSEPLQSGWLKFISPNLQSDGLFEITIYNDKPNTKAIKLYDDKNRFLWGNKL